MGLREPLSGWPGRLLVCRQHQHAAPQPRRHIQVCACACWGWAVCVRVVVGCPEQAHAVAAVAAGAAATGAAATSAANAAEFNPAEPFCTIALCLPGPSVPAGRASIILRSVMNSWRPCVPTTLPTHIPLPRCAPSASPAAAPGGGSTPAEQSSGGKASGLWTRGRCCVHGAACTWGACGQAAPGPEASRVGGPSGLIPHPLHLKTPVQPAHSPDAAPD